MQRLIIPPEAPMELSYPGAKPMLLAENVENGDKLRELLKAMLPELKE